MTFTYSTNNKILVGKPSPDAPRHKHQNKVSYTILNRDKVPPKQDGKKQIYRIIREGRTIGVGETTYIPSRISGGYAWCLRTMKPDGSTIIKAMQQEASAVNERGEVYHFDVEFLEQVDTRDARRTESEYVRSYRAQFGDQILNKTR